MLKIFCPDFRFDSIASIPVEWLKKATGRKSYFRC